MLDRVAAILKRRGIVGSAIMAADRATRPFGLSLISFTRLGAVPPLPDSTASKSKFDAIATGNLWGSSESLSGAGSEILRTERYRGSLIQLVEERGFQSMFDAPCGDLNWMHLALEKMDVEYVGGDISPSLIEMNRKRFPELKFIEFDITGDPFPAADVWHCRDCLFHLSYKDVDLALRNFVKSDIPHVLITNHRGLIRNVDIETGGWRYIDLRRAPFNLPAPETMLDDYNPGDLPRYVGLWTREQIAQALSGNGQANRALEGEGQH